MLFSFNFAQPTLTELPGLFFIIFLIYFYKINCQNTFTNGFIVGLAIMSRTNLGFLVFAYLVIYLREKYGLRKIIYFLIGSFLPFSLFGIYFIYKNAFINFLSGVFIEITYSSPNNKAVDFYNNVLVNKVENFDYREIILIFILLVVIYTIYKKNVSQNLANEMVLFLFIILSIFLGRSFFYHYLIQVYTLLTLLFIEVFNIIKIKKLNLIMIIFLIFIQVNLIFSGYQNIYFYENVSKNYPIKKIANELSSENVLAITDHLIYFYNDNEPPIVVHPGLYNNKEKFNNLFKNLISIGIIEKNEREFILKKKPKYILCDQACNEVLADDFIEQYVIYKKYLNTTVYELK